MLNEKAWLDSLKPGDRVAAGSRGTSRIIKVDRMTATQFICGRQRYRRDSGRLVGSNGFNSDWLRPLTPEIEAEVDRRNMLYILQYAKWNELPSDTLRAIVNAINTAGT